MTQKRFRKLMMARGYSRNEVNDEWMLRGSRWGNQLKACKITLGSEE